LRKPERHGNIEILTQRFGQPHATLQESQETTFSDVRQPSWTGADRSTALYLPFDARLPDISQAALRLCAVLLEDRSLLAQTAPE
jgi:hypothetical protein